MMCWEGSPYDIEVLSTLQNTSMVGCTELTEPNNAANDLWHGLQHSAHQGESACDDDPARARACRDPPFWYTICQEASVLPGGFETLRRETTSAPNIERPCSNVLNICFDAVKIMDHGIAGSPMCHQSGQITWPRERALNGRTLLARMCVCVCAEKRPGARFFPGPCFDFPRECLDVLKTALRWSCCWFQQKEVASWDGEKNRSTTRLVAMQNKTVRTCRHDDAMMYIFWTASGMLNRCDALSKGKGRQLQL